MTELGELNNLRIKDIVNFKRERKQESEHTVMHTGPDGDLVPTLVIHEERRKRIQNTTRECHISRTHGQQKQMLKKNPNSPMLYKVTKVDWGSGMSVCCTTGPTVRSLRQWMATWYPAVSLALANQLPLPRL